MVAGRCCLPASVSATVHIGSVPGKAIPKGFHGVFRTSGMTHRQMMGDPPEGGINPIYRRPADQSRATIGPGPAGDSGLVATRQTRPLRSHQTRTVSPFVDVAKAARQSHFILSVNLGANDPSSRHCSKPRSSCKADAAKEVARRN